jgi:hypothetical protein
MDTRVLKTGHLDDSEACYGDTYGYQCFDLETVTPQPSGAVVRQWCCRAEGQDGQMPAPEDIEAIAEI